MSSVECVPHLGKHDLVLSTVWYFLFAKWMKIIPPVNISVEKTSCCSPSRSVCIMPRVFGDCSHSAVKSEKQKSFWNRSFCTYAAREHIKNFPPSQPGSHGEGWAAALLVTLSWWPEIETNDWPGISTALLLILAREKIVRLFSVRRVNLHSFFVLFLDECWGNSKQISPQELHSPLKNLHSFLTSLKEP